MAIVRVADETKDLLACRHNGTFSHNGRDYVVAPGVFPPNIFSSSSWFARTLPDHVSGDLLEIGTGTGIVGIETVLHRCQQATLTDRDPIAVANAQANVLRHGLQNRITVLQSDVFNTVKRHDYDALFWALPFGYTESDQQADHRVFDPQYKAIQRFVREAHKFVARGGSVLIGWSDSIGNREQLERILRSERQRAICLEQTQLMERRVVDMGIYELTQIQ